MPDTHPIAREAIAWSNTLNEAADAAFGRVSSGFEQGRVDYDTYCRALRTKGDVRSACLRITTEASGKLLAVAEGDLEGVRAGTKTLSEAIEKVKLVQDAASLLGALAVAAVALGAAVAAPSPATLGAAAGALGAVGKQIAEEIDD